MERPRCETCPYYYVFDPEMMGECRRNAAGTFIVPDSIPSGDVHAHWPFVDIDDWCGEHPDFPAYLTAIRPDAPRPNLPNAFIAACNHQLGARGQEAIRKLGVRSFDELGALTMQQILCVRGVGWTTYSDLQKFLKKNGYHGHVPAEGESEQ